MLPIHEQFYTFQGEGIHAGRTAYFIRTFGCPVHCPWCDSAGTWHPDYIPKHIDRLTPEALASEVAKTKAEFVVVTGGEPTIHNLEPLSTALHAIDRAVHLETSGAFPIKGTLDWITLSPKRWKAPLPENVANADEFKIIVDSIDSIQEYSNMLTQLGAKPETPIWLHPEWSKHADQALLDAITEWIKDKGAPYRAGWQMHKNYAADLKDSRSAPAAPLGGKPELGF
jgi:organic radical activating enzyme